MVLEASNRLPRETGGILLGHWADGRQAVVTHVIGPGPLARHGYSTFEPDYQFQEAEIVRICASVDGGCDYLGDWHSHPRGSPHPSARDIRVLRTIAGYAAARCKHPVMCIVFGGPHWAASACQLVDGRCLDIDLVTTAVGDGKTGRERSSSRKLFLLVRNTWRAPRT